MNSKKTLVGLLMFFSLGSAFGEEAIVRLRCEGDSAGGDVFINGKLKAQCPTDLVIPEGQVKLLVVKNLDRGRYRSFEKNFFVSGGAVQRFEVVLGDILFTAEGRKLEDARLEAIKVAAAKEAARQAQLKEEARLQAERDAPRIAAEKVKAEKEAAIAAEAARRAQPGAVKNFMDQISSKGPDTNFSMATLGTTYAPLFLPISTTTDLIDGKKIAMTDPAVFGNPDSMVANAVQLQAERQKSRTNIELAQR